MRPTRRNIGRYIRALLTAAAAFACLQAPARAETALDAFVEGERLRHRHSDRSKALAAFERAVALDPDFAAPHYYLTELHSRHMDGREPDLERMIAEGEAFLRLADPDNPADREAMLRTLDRLLSGSVAQLAISSYAPIDIPRPTPAQRIAWRQQQVELGGLQRYGSALVTAYLDAGQFDQALATCDAALALALDQDQRAYFESRRVYVLVRAGRWQEELAAREQAAVERPDDPAAHRALADIYDRLGRTRAAVKALRRAVALDPGDVHGHLRLAEFYQRLGWRSLVQQECLQVLRIDPENRRAGDMLVPHEWGGLRGFRTAGLPGGAEGIDLTAVLPVLITTRRSSLLARLAEGYLNSGDPDTAIRVARQALEIAGDRSLPAGTLCRAYVKAGRANEIEAAIMEIGRRNPAMLPRLVDAWAGAIAYDERAWPELASLLDNPYLVGHERARRFQDYARKLNSNDRRPEAIEVLERALSPSERVSMGDIGSLYQDLVRYHRDQLAEREKHRGRLSPDRWNPVLAVCRRYVEEAPFSDEPYFLLARTYRDAGRKQEAEAAYRRALQFATSESRRGRALSGLAALLLADGRAAEAVTCLRDPAYLRNELDTRLRLIEALIKAGERDEARASLAEVFAFLSRRSYWWGGSRTQDRLVEVVEALEGANRAIARIRAAFEHDPSAGPLARILINRYEDAEQYSALVAMASEIRISSESGWRSLDDILDALGDGGQHELGAQVALDMILSGRVSREYHVARLARQCVEAVRQAEKLGEMGTRVEAAFAKEPGNMAVAFLLAQLYKAADRGADALRVYADLAEEYPHDNTVVGWLLSEARNQPEHDQLVLPYLERAVLGEPGRSERHIQLAGVLNRMERDREAAAEYTLAFETEANPLQMRYLADQFVVHERLGTTADLIKRYQQFAADWPDDPVAYLVVAMVYRQAERREAAVAQLNRASELAGGRREIRRRLCELYRELDMPDRALAELRMLVDATGRDRERLDALREYVRLCREMKRYGEAIAAIDDVIAKIDAEDWMAGQLARLRQETVEAMEHEPPRVRLLLSVRRLWECAERDLAAGAALTSQAQVLLQGWVQGDPRRPFSYDVTMSIAAPNARGDGTMVVTCEGDRCQAQAGGMLPLPGGRAFFRHSLMVDEGGVTNPRDGCLVTRRLVPIVGGRHRCTVAVRLPWAAKVSLVFPAGAALVGDQVEGAARDGDRFVAVFNDPAAIPASPEFSAALRLAPGVTDYAPEVIIERISEPRPVPAGETMGGVGFEFDIVHAQVEAPGEFFLERYDTETRWALRMAPIAESGR